MVAPDNRPCPRQPIGINGERVGIPQLVQGPGGKRRPCPTGWLRMSSDRSNRRHVAPHARVGPFAGTQKTLAPGTGAPHGWQYPDIAPKSVSTQHTLGAPVQAGNEMGVETPLGESASMGRIIVFHSSRESVCRIDFAVELVISKAQQGLG